MGGFNLNKAVSQLIVQTAKAKGWLGCLILALFMGCGQSTNPVSGVDLAGAKILSQGDITTQADPLQSAFEDVKACVTQNYNGPIMPGSPTFIVVDRPFTCGGQETSAGCTDLDANIIYLMDSTTLRDPSYNSLFAHELIHWLTGVGVEGHSTYLFNVCEYPAWRGKWLSF